MHNCLIRELTGNFDKLVDLVENELKFIYITREYPCFVKTFGFFINDKEETKILQYSLVYKNYQNTLAESKSIDEALKIKYIHNLISTYKVMATKSFYHGNISPYNVHLNEFGEIVLGNFLYTNRIENSSNINGPLYFIDNDFCAPEIKIKKKYPDSKIEYNFVKADLFSLGLTILSLFIPIEELNEIKLDQGLEKLFVNTSVTKVQYLVRKKMLDTKILTEILRLEDLIRSKIDNIQSGFCFYFFFILLMVCYNDRCNLDELITNFEESYAKFNNEQLKYPIVETKLFSLDFKDRKFRMFLESFILFLDTCDSKNYSLEKSLHYFQDQFNRIAGHYSRKIEKLIISYFEKEIDSTIQVHEGLSTFFGNFLDGLKNLETFLNFLNILKTRINTCNYSHTFSIIMHAEDEVIKDLIVSLFYLFAFTREHWYFFFPSLPKSLKYLSYTKFNTIEILETEFRNIISTDIIMNELISINKTE